MKIGFFGAGRMAATFAKTLVQMDDVARYAVAARDLNRAERFASEYGFERAYGSYEQLLSDPEVDLVYIATPHSHHAEHMKLCIDHGKAILCEKAFTLNAAQAKEVLALAQEKGVFVTEAIWTRYMPSRQIINDVLDSGIIGKVTTLTANLCYDVTHKERCMKPELAGGALLDVGIYGLNFALMHFGSGIERIESAVQFTDTGVDAQETITIFYKDRRMAVITAGMLSRSDRKGIFYGDKGYIIVENINNPQSARVYDTSDHLIQEILVPQQISGYEYQIRECARMLAENRLESRSMPHADTLFVMEVMDRIRNQWGFRYPMESSSGGISNA